MDKPLTVFSTIDVKIYKWNANSEMSRDCITFITFTTQSTSNGPDKTDTLENISRPALCHLIP